MREHRGSSNYTGSVGRENGGVAYTGGIVPTLCSTYTVDGVGVGGRREIVYIASITGVAIRNGVYHLYRRVRE